MDSESSFLVYIILCIIAYERLARHYRDFRTKGNGKEEQSLFLGIFFVRSLDRSHVLPAGLNRRERDTDVDACFVCFKNRSEIIRCNRNTTLTLELPYRSESPVLVSLFPCFAIIIIPKHRLILLNPK